MQLIFEMNFGYVTCDIHGDAYNRVWVYLDEWSPETTQWRAILSSRCYGDEEKGNLSTEELIQFMESKRFFVATRSARRNFNRFLEGMRRGKFNPVAAPSSPPEFSMMTVIDPDGMEPDSPVEADDYDDSGYCCIACDGF